MTSENTMPFEGGPDHNASEGALGLDKFVAERAATDAFLARAFGVDLPPEPAIVPTFFDGHPVAPTSFDGHPVAPTLHTTNFSFNPILHRERLWTPDGVLIDPNDPDDEYGLVGRRSIYVFGRPITASFNPRAGNGLAGRLITATELLEDPADWEYDTRRYMLC